MRRDAETVLRAAGATPLVVFGPSPSSALDAPQLVTAERWGVFRLEGGTWTLTFDDRTVRLPEAKGLKDLRTLLAHPGTPVPASALQQACSPLTSPRSHGVDVLDDQARGAYRARLHDLDTDIAEAQEMGDAARADRARDERDFLLAELSAAVGLGGRSRRLGDDGDRARKAVTMRIRNAITRISRLHPSLGRHLSLAVRTGTVCSYEPEQPVRWTV